eukprot:2153048-Alexandrium_andersonii.AAC.1
MSASLVGSEMCIRDSGTAAAVLRSLSRASQRPPSHIRGCSRTQRGGYRCLLYTSDAADDM